MPTACTLSFISVFNPDTNSISIFCFAVDSPDIMTQPELVAPKVEKITNIKGNEKEQEVIKPKEHLKKGAQSVQGKKGVNGTQGDDYLDLMALIKVKVYILIS